MAVDTAIFARCKEPLAKLEQLVLAHKGLPAVAGDPGGINSTGRTPGSAVDWTIQDREPIAIGSVAVHCARNPQICWHREFLARIGKICHQGGRSAIGETIPA